MPINNGVYSLPAGWEAVTGTTIQSAKYNAALADLASAINTNATAAAANAASVGTLTAMFEQEATFDGPVNVGTPDIASASAKGVEVNDYSEGGSVIVQASASAADTVPLLRLFAGTEQVVRVETGGKAAFKGPVRLGETATSSAAAKGVELAEYSKAGSLLIQALPTAGDYTPMMRIYRGTDEMLRINSGGSAQLAGADIWTSDTAGPVVGSGRGAARLARNIGSNSYGDRAIMPGYELQAATADGETTGSPFTGSWRVNGKSKPGKVTLVIKE